MPTPSAAVTELLLKTPVPARTTSLSSGLTAMALIPDAGNRSLSVSGTQTGSAAKMLSVFQTPPLAVPM